MKLFSRMIPYVLLVMLTGACTTSTRIKSGTEAYQLKKYALAIPLLQEEYNKSKENARKADIAWMIAQSFDLQNRFDEAEPWYKIFRELSTQQEAPVQYARALMRNEKYAEAKEIIEQYLKINRQDRKLYEPLLNTCEYVLKEGENDQKNVRVTPLPFNSTGADFDPNVIDGKIIFSSTRTRDNDDLKTEWNEESYASLWEADLKGNQVAKSELFDDNYHVASLTMTKDGQTAYFTRCGSDQDQGNDYCGIYRVKKENGSWSAPEKLSFFGDTVNNGQPFISPDGKILYFASDAPFGYGGKDLYLANIQKDGSYSEPVNLGSRVNTPYNELYPYVTEDGNTLFYASDNLQSFGGLDIFKATKAGRLFTNPERLPYGVNTGRDDFALELLPDDGRDTTIAYIGIFSSNRTSGAGSDDLYLAEIKKIIPKTLPPALLIFEGLAVENIYADSTNPNSKVTGQQPVPYPVVTLSGSSLSADQEGFFTTQLDSGFAYQLKVSKENYLSATIDFNTVNVKSRPGDTIYFRQTVILSRIYRDVEIVLDNIYYDYDKWDIREDARPTLDSLTGILQQNPQISIELASHTDCRGNDEYNMNLSQKRAESVVQYLISKGIDSQRLSAKGYGESMPVEKCNCTDCTEEQHQRNRRTTFKILKDK